MEEWIIQSAYIAAVSLGIGVVIGRVLLLKFYKQEEEKNQGEIPDADQRSRAYLGKHQKG